MPYFIKLMITQETEDLMRDPPAFMLLTQIAVRARRTPGNICYRGSLIRLELGQSLIGDFANIGITEQQYRSAKKRLETNGLVTFKSTPRGTIATICNSLVYDIIWQDDNEQITDKTTDSQRTANGQPTTNRDSKIGRREDKNIIYAPLSEFLKKKIINSGSSAIIKNSDLANWSNDFRLMVEQDHRTENQIREKIESVFCDSFWCKNIRSAGKLREQWNAGKLDRLNKSTTLRFQENAASKYDVFN